MKTESIKNLIKTILYFGLISICFDLVRKIIFARFDLFKLFNVDYLLYEVVLEFILLMITAFATHLCIKNITYNNLGFSLLKSSIFGIIYGIISFIFVRLISFSMGAGNYFQLDIFHSLLNYIPNGLMEGVLFMLVLNHLKPINKN
jgi:hypothetical protein